MFVTSSEQRGGLLVAVISGGRPALKERPISRYLTNLREAGVSDVVWSVSERDAPDYEQDGNPLLVYPKEWAYEYARAHWMLSTEPNPQFLGAFPGREWACLEAERRGCWGVLQLDDNIDRFTFPNGNIAARLIVDQSGGAARIMDLLAAVTLATNGRMVGANLQSVPNIKMKIARPGFPYSCFIEQVGAGREDWYGPFEDDITHAFQYGTRADSASSTAVVMPLLRYHKEPNSRSAMRAYYDNTRAVSLQKIFPEAAKVTIRRGRSNGRGTARVYHQMSRTAIKNQLVVKDRDLYLAVKMTIERMLIEWKAISTEKIRAKVMGRAKPLANVPAEK
jgi:hypothetical protein